MNITSIRDFMNILVEADVLDEKMLKNGKLDHDAREFGLWLTRTRRAMYPDDDNDGGVYNYDYMDDETGQALRYRLIVDKTYLAFIHALKPQIADKGWHLTVETKRARNRWQLVFEPLLAPKVTRAAVYWHVTPTKNVPTILRSGLEPRDSRFAFSYPQRRIYLIKDEKDAARMVRSLSQRDQGETDYSLIRVDLARARGVRLHADPEMSSVAVYTTQPVPAASVSLTQEKVAPSW